MALAKDQIPHDSSMGNKVQTCVFNHKSVLEQEHGTQSTNELSNDSGTSINHSPPLCGSDNGYVYKGRNYQLEEAEPLINFKESSGYSNIMQASESSLSFQQSRLVPNNCYLKDSSSQKEYCVYENNMHQGYQTASGYSSIVSSAKEKQHGQSSYGWLYSEPTMHVDSLQNQKSRTEESVLKKRPAMGENMKATKKQCSNESKAPKPRSSTSKDPQSVAAKNRRERISERLKILQELVPNGSKVDLVTMLEKAISYVKFLQLQVKVLATDEFWPVQGGKPPDISQVKEAIEAIFSSQRDRSSSSK